MMCFFALIGLIFATSASAQELVGAVDVSAIGASLGRVGASGGSVEVLFESTAAGAVRAVEGAPRRSSVMAFGVSLLRDNSQSARANAYGTASQFSEIFPGVEVEVRYESPWFIVTAGRFVDRTDAVALCGRAISKFPKAFVTQRESTVAQVIEAQKSILSELEK